MEAQLTLDYNTRVLLAWATALLLAIGLRYAGRHPWHRSAGFALMSIPLWMTAWSYVNTIQRLTDPGSSLPTYSTWILSSIWTRGVLVDLGYIGAGFLVFVSGGRWRSLLDDGIAGLARKLRESGLPMGNRSEGASIAVGLLAFPVFLFGTLLINWLIYSQPGLVNGDEASVWANMTPYHAIFISLSAGIGEELVYRGVLMVGLLHLLHRVPRPWGATIAVTIQALVFGFAHAGYGTWAHVIVPSLFGLFAGAVAMRFGIWAAIVFHILVDIYAFGVDAGRNVPWFWQLLMTALLLNTLGTGAWAMRWTWQRFMTPRAQ